LSSFPDDSDELRRLIASVVFRRIELFTSTVDTGCFQIWKTLESTETRIAEMTAALQQDCEVNYMFLEDNQQVKYASGERERLRPESVETEGFYLSVSILSLFEITPRCALAPSGDICGSRDNYAFLLNFNSYKVTFESSYTMCYSDDYNRLKFPLLINS
jgi:hypothetical protein